MQDEVTVNFKVGDLVYLKQVELVHPVYIARCEGKYFRVIYSDSGGIHSNRFWCRSALAWPERDLILIKDENIIKEYLPLFRFADILLGRNDRL